MIKLRLLTENDLPFLLEVRNDESTRQFLENNSEFTYLECRTWFENTNPEWYIIEVDELKVGYVRTNGDEIGCDIHPDYRRKGYAKTAYEIYLKDKSYASLWVFEDNFAKDLYTKSGFKATESFKYIRERKYIKMEYHG
jgi:hypothetical protein|tara:strand:+ start:382 stop:798 length:417 start_codon:yes stop_codon:yes gene_type:complete